jgi:MoaA/NifB/PqqE/SkfB family radical SAM enzyme/SAM-dependent methyltransferase
MKGVEFFERIARQSSMSRLHPRVGEFFREYLRGEKAIQFGDQWVLNTHFPPFPSRAFDGLAEQFLGDGTQRRLFSVTLAVTNRCSFNCWHCYNAGRAQEDVPLKALETLAHDLQDLGAAVVMLTGGEPLLRDDLEQIVAAFDDRTCVNLGTTGWDLSDARAAGLKSAGIFATGISLDSDDHAEHDRLRGREGAFQAALAALATIGRAGMYPYVVTVARRELLERERFMEFMAFAGRIGAKEVHLLEPIAIGRLAGRDDVTLNAAERQHILDYQREIADREDLPILSTFTYLESADAFGCGAGLTHLYIDGSGDVCPCNLVPIAFGNILHEPLREILDRMGCHFRQPRPGCVGQLLSRRIGDGPLPTPPRRSQELCRRFLPAEHALPAFFRTRQEARDVAGVTELSQAYDRVHDDYDDFWLVQAGKPVVELVEKLRLSGSETVFEAGCGSGFGTALLASRLARGGRITAVDISEGMLSIASRRLEAAGRNDVEFILGDAMEALARRRDVDIVFTSWVLGYIPIAPFFAVAARAMKPGGRLAMLVHRENSPVRELGIFAELVAHDPSVLRKQVAFDFPRDQQHVRDLLASAGLKGDEVWQGQVTFTYHTSQEVLEHLLKSGAGTVFYDALDPARRDELTRQFLKRLDQLTPLGGPFDVIHQYVACIASRPAEA